MIREAQVSEVRILTSLIYDAWKKDLFGLVAAKVSTLFSEEWFTKRLQIDFESELTSILIYEKGDKILGIVIGKFLNGAIDSEISGLYVGVNAQQIGIGDQLFDKMKSQFVSHKKSKMLVWTLLGAANNAFYLKHSPIEIIQRDIDIFDLKYPGIGYIYSLV